MIHELKTEQKYFKEVVAGRKTFEMRVNDRDFNVGDFLALNEIDKKRELYRALLPCRSYIHT